MAKKIYKYTQYPPFYVNQYGWGGDSLKALGTAFNQQNAGSSIAGIGGALTSMVGAGVNNAQIGDTSSIENDIQNTQNLKFSGSTNDALMQSWQQYNPLDKTSYKDVRGGSNSQRIMSALGAGVSGASTGVKMGGPVGAAIGGAVGLGSGIWGLLAGNKKANKKTAELNAQIAQANQQAFNNFGNSVQNVDNNTDLNLLANYVAYGGKINKMSNGGHTHGAEWDNGITVFDNGDTHEQNPNGGVQIGIDPQGIPNMVEEGEVRYGDYILSNRITMPKEFRKQYNLKNNSTFADAAKKLSKESKERPNDPISKAGLDVSMTKLVSIQEAIKAEQQPKQQVEQQPNIFAGGTMQIPKFKPGSVKSGVDMYPDKQMPSFTMTPQELGINIGQSNNGVDEEYWNTLYKTRKVASDPLKFNTSTLRYAPVLGAGIGVFSDLMGWTNKPNYSNANMIAQSTKNLSNVEFNPLGNYMAYKPLDRNYYLNQLQGTAGATRRDIINQSGGNRATAMAGLLASDYNTTGSIGKLAREAEEYNLNQRQKVEDFNKATNMFNIEGSMKAQMANKANEELRLKSAMAQAEMRDKADIMSSQAKTANLTNLFDSIGDIGREEFAKNQIGWEVSKGIYGNFSYDDIMSLKQSKQQKYEMLKKQGYTDDELKDKGFFANGGKLNNRKKGLTF